MPPDVGRMMTENEMAKLPNREQIATAIVKTGVVSKSFDEVLAVLKTMPLNTCRWILHRYPNVRAAMNAARRGPHDDGE